MAAGWGGSLAGLPTHEDGRINVSLISQNKRIELLVERGEKASGFPAEDEAKLQRILDEEWEASRAEREKEREAELARRRAAEQAEKKKRQLERQLADEADAVRNDPKLAFWMQLVQANKTPPDMLLQGCSPVGVRAFVKVLGPCTSLRTLDLSRCRLRDDVGRYLADALRVNSALMSLNLSDNAFTASTAGMLAEALGVNRSLMSLSLNSNPLTNKGKDFSGVQALGDALVGNSTLVHLGLFQCGLGQEGGQALVGALAANSTLRTVQVSHIDGISVEQQSFITDRLAANKALLQEQRRSVKARRADARRAEGEREEKAAADAAAAFEADWLEAQRLKREAERSTAAAAAAEADAAAEAEREDRYKRWRAVTDAQAKKGKKGKKGGKGKK